MATKKSRIPADPKVGRRLKIVLEYHGISQNELARLVGVTSGAVSQWITGKNALTTLNAARIAEALGEDPEFLLGRTDKGSKGMGALLAKMEAELGSDLLKKLEPILEEHPGRFGQLVKELLQSEFDSDEKK